MKEIINKLGEGAVTVVSLIGLTVSAVMVIIGLTSKVIGEGIEIAGHWLHDQVHKLNSKSTKKSEPAKITAE